jgi:hypothetical protein
MPVIHDPRFDENSDVKAVKLGSYYALHNIGWIYGGRSTSDYVSSANLNEKFLDFFFQGNGASGSVQGLYIRLNQNTAGTAAQVGVRSYVTITAALTTPAASVGVHSTVEIGAGGSNSALCAAGRFQIGATAATRTLTGTKTALLLEGNWGAGNTLATEESFIMLTDLVTTVPTTYFVDMNTLTSAAAGAFYAGTHGGTTVSGVWRVRIPGGAIGYVKIFSD